MRRSQFLILLLFFFAIPQFLSAGTIDFEGLADSSSVTNQFPGLLFSNATVLTAGVSLNEFEFPPQSGDNVVFDDGGPISILFSVPVLSFSGYFTYLAQLTLTAYDSSDNVLGSITSSYLSNLVLSGDPGSIPNELLELAFAGGISKVTISGDLGGGSFTLDDVTVATAVSEPSTFYLMLTGSLALFAACRGRRGR